MSEDCKASQERLNRIVLLIAIAYTWAGLAGQKLKHQGQHKYVNRLKEPRRVEPRHSNFWTGLYGQIWIASMEFCQDFIRELMRIRPNKLPFYLHRSKCYEPDSASFLALSSPRKRSEFKVLSSGQT